MNLNMFLEEKLNAPLIEFFLGTLSHVDNKFSPRFSVGPKLNLTKFLWDKV